VGIRGCSGGGSGFLSLIRWEFIDGYGFCAVKLAALRKLVLDGLDFELFSRLIAGI
jgi:hypothetical protein